MKKSVSRILSRAGESFSEVLVAILIVAMAALLMASMVSASGSIDRAARMEDADFYEAISNVEEGTATTSPGTVTITEGAGLQTVTVPVTVYSSEDGLTAYEVTP